MSQSERIPIGREVLDTMRTVLQNIQEDLLTLSRDDQELREHQLQVAIRQLEGIILSVDHLCLRRV